MDILLLLFLFQLFYLMLKFGPMQSIFSDTLRPTINKLTKKQVKTYLIPIVGLYFIIRDWYKTLED